MPHKEISAQERREKLNNELNRMLPMIIEIGVEKVILIGSMATGKTHSLSDINLIIIKKTNKLMKRCTFIITIMTAIVLFATVVTTYFSIITSLK